MNLSKSTKRDGPAFPQNYSVMDPQIEKSGNKGHYTQESLKLLEKYREAKRIRQDS